MGKTHPSCIRQGGWTWVVHRSLAAGKCPSTLHIPFRFDDSNLGHGCVTSCIAQSYSTQQEGCGLSRTVRHCDSSSPPNTYRSTLLTVLSKLYCTVQYLDLARLGRQDGPVSRLDAVTSKTPVRRALTLLLVSGSQWADLRCANVIHCTEKFDNTFSTATIIDCVCTPHGERYHEA
jgi:hypothetical protein